jgi:hypothetical protein
MEAIAAPFVRRAPVGRPGSGRANRDTGSTCASSGFRSADVVLRRQGFTDRDDDGSGGKRGAMGTSSLRGTKQAEVATNRGQVTRTLHRETWTVLTKDRMEGE